MTNIARNTSLETSMNLRHTCTEDCEICFSVNLSANNSKTIHLQWKKYDIRV